MPFFTRFLSNFASVQSLCTLVRLAFLNCAPRSFTNDVAKGGSRCRLFFWPLNEPSEQYYRFSFTYAFVFNVAAIRVQTEAASAVKLTVS